MPGVFIGSTEVVDVGDIKIGSTNVQEIYVGATKIWPSGAAPTPSFTWDPLTNGPGTLPGGATFTRPSVALEFDGTEYVSKSSGAIRDAHIAFSGGARGYLSEPAATNLITQSSTFDVAPWSEFGSLTITDDGINDLALNQSTFDAGAGSGTHSIFIKLTSVDVHTLYVIAKEGTGQFFNIGAGNSGSAFVTFDSVNGTITETGTGLSIVGRIELISNDWDKSEITLDVQPSGDDFISIALSEIGTPGTLYPSFGGSNETILFSHSQYEKSLFSTSPIITSGSEVTRVADVLDSGETIGAAFSALFDFTAPAAIGTGNTISLLGAATSAVDVIRLDENFNVIMDDGGTPTTIGAVAANQRFRVSYGRDGAGRSGSLDGATAVTGGAPASAHEGETFQLYSTASVNQARGVGHLVNLYASRLTDGELESISS